ncbi:hypothetical protein AXG89_26945 (plasmid) [Burkholderia sp. PAMC 26561]|nr:hypothetical protein AXG89_25745 [Burkholderia sp. PAMC 26561]AME27552.2 hypothetical protein AXG89_26945 [Burkholderia sp. PAMC 26561]
MTLTRNREQQRAVRRTHGKCNKRWKIVAAMSRGLGRLCLFFNQFLPVALQLALQVFESADRQAYACMNHIYRLSLCLSKCAKHEIGACESEHDQCWVAGIERH